MGVIEQEFILGMPIKGTEKYLTYCKKSKKYIYVKPQKGKRNDKTTT